MKKILLTILCTLLSTMSWAQGTAGDSASVVEPYAVISESNTDGQTLTFYYDTQKTARNGMSIGPFNSSSERGWNYIYTITTVVFDDSFANYTTLTSTAWWFADTRITNIVGLSNLNTSNVTTMNNMFDGSRSLTSLTFSLNTSKVENMSCMFQGCTSLVSLELNNFDTSNVTDMSNMFSGCGQLVDIVNMSLNTDKVQNMQGMFSGCDELKGINLSSFNTANVTDMSEMFSQCMELESLDVSTFNTANVINMKGMFSECRTLTTLDLSSFNTAKVENMNTMFRDCRSLTTIYVSDQWSTSAVTDGTDMFTYCVELKGGSGTTTVYGADHTYAHIDGGENNPGYFTEKSSSYNEAYAVLVIDENNTASLTMYYDANRDAHREGQVIGLDEMMQNQAWMMYRENVTTVVFDSSFANCRPTSTAFWFAYCRSLTSIVGLQYLRTDETTNMSFMFNECSSLTSLDLSSLNTENVTNISGMLGGCRSLTSVDLSGFNTRQVTNMNSLFEQSAALTTINLSSFNTSQVTDMSYMFNECSALTTIYVGSDWSTEAVTNGTDMFNKCTNLVGGAGTTYSADHTDYTYARIDAEGTPGYLTGDGTKPSETVSAPIFAFDGDNLSMTTETANASIFYKMEELPTMDEAYVDSVSNSLIVTPDGQQSTYYERPFELKTSAIVKAIAVIDTQAGTIASDTTTMVYDYAAWLNLRTAIEKGIEIYELAKDNSNVETSLKEQLQWALQEGNMLYRERAMMNSFEATHFAQRINELSAQVQAQMSGTDEPYAVLSDNNTVLTFYYDKQKSARGGMSVGPFAYETERGWNSNASDITSLVFDESFAEYHPTSTAMWFQSCSNLKSITNIQYLKTDSVTTMGGMFSGCSSLTNIDLSNFNTDKVTSMFAMFSGCSSLMSLDLSKFNTTNVTETGAMFSSCSSLTSLDLSNFNTSNMTNVSSMFAYSTSLKTLDLSGFRFNSATFLNIRFMFRECIALQTIYVDENWTLPSSINGSSMFEGCTSLVGGAGTIYSADHTDYTYAHIDGGTANPGYFTDKNATPLEKVAVPTFSWRNDELTMSCSTEGATIMYQMSDEDTNGDGVINDDDYKQYSAPIEVKRDVIIKAIATKEGMTTSDPITLDYPYEAWTRLYETCIIGQEILYRASRSSRVPQEMVDQGEAYIAYALDMYAKRTEDKERVENTTADIAVFLNEIEQMMQVPATYSNYVLTATEDATMAEIADQYGSYYGNQVAAIVWNSSVAMTESDLQRFTSNPNLLIYAQSESLVPANRNNVVINGVAKNVVLTTTATGNCNFYAPQEFTAEAIQYTRTFSQQTQIGFSRGWEAIALPFTVQTYTHADRGVIAPFGNSASENHFWLRELTQNGLQNAQTIEANKPYIISMPNSEEYRPETNLAGQVTFSALNAIVPVTEATPVEYGSISLVPAFQSRSAQTEIYALNVGEERNGYPEGSVFERDYRTVRPFEAYTLHRDNQNPAPQFIMIGGDMGNGTTGIEDLVDKRMNTNDSWYTIDGRRLQGAPAGKGLYIRNGKKVIVR